jgi:HSF-type DNA-binding
MTADVSADTDEIRDMYLNSNAGDDTANCDDDCTTKSTFPKDSEESNTHTARKLDCVRPVFVKTCVHRITRHEYHDHASDPTVELGFSVESSSPPKANASQSPSSNNGKIVPFPIKLFEMIQQLDTDGLAHIISWQPHGRCFLVHQPSTFQKLLRKYFKISKISSFQRQLNLYDFRRLTVGSDKGSYYHEFFIRNRPDLLSKVRRIKVKGTGIRAKTNPKEEPNLYSYPSIDKCEDTGVYNYKQASSIATKQNTSAHLSVQVNSGTSFLSSAVLTACYISPLDDDYDIARIAQEEDDDYTLGFGPFEFTSISLDNEQPPSLRRNGHIRNLSLMNVSSSVWDVEKETLQPQSILRNVSSSLLDNNQSYTSNDSHVGEADAFENAFEQGESTNCCSRLDFSDKISKKEIEALLLPHSHDSEISFEKIVGEMFQGNQKYDFSSLVKLATED